MEKKILFWKYYVILFFYFYISFIITPYLEHKRFKKQIKYILGTFLKVNNK